MDSLAPELPQDLQDILAFDAQPASDLARPEPLAFDNHIEQFFDELNNGEWKVLAKGNSYPATRLASEPLEPKSQIDYLIRNKDPGKGGLFGEEVTAEQATVHHGLADGDWYYFRRTFSDHFPVTTCVAVMADND